MTWVAFLFTTGTLVLVNVAGTVHAPGENAYLPGVTIRIKTADGRVARQGVTDAGGRFVFTALVPGEYEAESDLAGTLRYSTRFCLRAEKQLDIELHFGHGECQCVYGVDAHGNRMPPLPNKVSGVIRDESGSPVRSASVELFIRDKLYRSVRTGRRGRFEIDTGTDEEVVLRIHAASFFDEVLNVNGDDTALRVVLHERCPSVP